MDLGAIQNIAIEGLNISFNGVPPIRAVQALSLQVRQGQTLAVVGESGSGKSLTALALMGLLPQNAEVSGQLIFNNNTETTIALSDIKRLAAHRGKDIALIFQEPMTALNPVMKVGRQVEEAISTHQQLSRTAARALATEWLQRVQLPDPGSIYHRYPHQLSGGQKQRVMIAMALCNHPALLIADEPTTALDVTVQQEIQHLLQHLQQQYGMAMLFITHDLKVAAALADDMLVMRNGAVVEYGTATQILNSPREPYTRALMDCRPGAANQGYYLPTVQSVMDGKAMEHLPAKNCSAQALLTVQDLKVWYAAKANFFGKVHDYHKAVDGVSFDIMQGETLGLAGESGCGKSTLSRCLMGLTPAISGSIVFQGREMVNADVAIWRNVRKQIQLVFQDPYGSLHPRKTIGTMLAEPLLVHQIVDPGMVAAEVRRLLNMVQLPDSAADNYAHEFSGGQRQRIGIARALSLRPKLLICDESVAALDVSIQAQILNLLKDLQYELGLTYLFVAHDLSVIRHMCNRVLIMQKGKVVESGATDQLFESPQHAYTRKLLQSVIG